MVFGNDLGMSYRQDTDHIKGSLALRRNVGMAITSEVILMVPWV